MGDKGRVAPATAHAAFAHLFVPGACCTPCARLVLIVPPTLIHTSALPSHPLVLICLSLCLFGPPTLPSYLAAVVIVVATAAPAAAAVAAAAAPAASCRCCCSAVTIAVAAVVAAVIAAADAATVAAAAAHMHSLSLVLWLACTRPLFYLWCLSTTIYL